MFKEVLVCVAGATPQIITETLYALANKNPPVYINEIYIITTAVGKKLIEENLLKKGILNKLLDDYNLPSIKIDENSIIVIKDRNGFEIDDIRNESESEATGDLITSVIRKLTKDPGIRLHCSIAGGRKTMSFYLGSALQFYGRPWDRLYHVLVSPEFESNPEFYYKPKDNYIIKCRLPDGSFVERNTSQAKIEITELPYIRLREKLTLHEKTFKELIEETQKEIDTATLQPEIRVNFKKRLINIAGKSIQLHPFLLAIYATFLNQKFNCNNEKNCTSCIDCYFSLVELTREPLAEKLAEFYGRLYDFDQYEKIAMLNKIKNQLHIDTLRSYISKINRHISNSLGNDALASYCIIKSIRKYGATVYGLMVDKKKIKFD